MLLMCKDIEVAKYNEPVDTYIVYREDLLPLELRGNFNLTNLFLWLINRVISTSRSNAKMLLNALQLSQTNKLVVCYACKGLSLMDCYWLKESGSTDTWGSVSLYRNSFSDALSNIALTGNSHGRPFSIQGRLHTPELGDNGSYAKCWRRFKGKIYLYKAGTGRREEYREVLSSMILDKLGISHVEYTLSESCFITVSRCELMTSETISIAPIEELYNYCTRNGINVMDWLWKQRGFCEMLIADYILWNKDRHFSNWGYYFSPDTGEVLGLHPLFDHNLCLFKQEDVILSQAIAGKTIEEAARIAKLRYNGVNTDALLIWLKNRKTRALFRKYLKSNVEYKELVNRVLRYRKWS